MSVVTFVKRWWIDALALAVVGIVFVVPFVFIVFTAAKDQAESARLQFTPPTDWLIVDNLLEVIGFRNDLMVTAMRNSLILTVASVTLIVLFAAMVGFVLQRRRDRFGALVSALMLAGLIIPPAIVPTIYVLQALGPVQDAARADAGGGGVPAALLGPDLPRLRGEHPARAR